MNLFAMLIQLLLVLLGHKQAVGDAEATTTISDLIALIQKAETVGADFLKIWNAVVTHSLADAVVAVKQLLTDLGVQV